MSQYKNLFASSRIPKEGKDELHTAPGSKHIAVQHRGHFYKVDVLDANGKALSQDDLVGAFESILKQNTAPEQQPIGVGRTCPFFLHRFATLY